MKLNKAVSMYKQMQYYWSTWCHVKYVLVYRKLVSGAYDLDQGKGSKWKDRRQS